MRGGKRYDSAGNRTAFRFSRAGITERVEYKYDGFHRLEKVKDADGEEFVYSYNLAGTRASLVYPNGTRINYPEYDVINRVKRISYEINRIPQKPVLLDSVSFEYDNINNITKRTTQAEAESYAYDDNYRMTGISYEKSGKIMSYEYNEDGLRTRVVEDGGEKAYSYRPGSEMLDYAGGVKYSYG